jgi:hypothetical protein
MERIKRMKRIKSMDFFKKIRKPNDFSALTLLKLYPLACRPARASNGCASHPPIVEAIAVMQESDGICASNPPIGGEVE